MNQQQNDDLNHYNRTSQYLSRDTPYQYATAYSFGRQNIESYAGGTSSGLAIILSNSNRTQQQHKLGQQLKLRKFGQSLNQAQGQDYVSDYSSSSPLVYYFRYEQTNQRIQCVRFYKQEQFAESQYNEQTIVEFYQNGYLIDYFDFCGYSEDFMVQMRNMRIPQRLLRRYIYGQRLLFIITDKTDKPLNWIPGAGSSLRNSSMEMKQEQIQQIRKESIYAKKQITIDKTKSIANIQVRLINGTKLILKVNQDTMIRQIHQYLQQTLQQWQSFILCAGFPPAPLNLETTISQNGLQQSVVVQKS